MMLDRDRLVELEMELIQVVEQVYHVIVMNGLAFEVVPREVQMDQVRTNLIGSTSEGLIGPGSVPSVQDVSALHHPEAQLLTDAELGGSQVPATYASYTYVHVLLLQ